MNKKTAQHLNSLTRRVRNPLSLVKSITDNTYYIEGGEALERDHMFCFIEECRKRVESEAVRREIMAAAKENRLVNTDTGGNQKSLLYWGQVNDNYQGAGGIAFKMVRDDIENEIKRLNTDATNMWEAYRLACEQGVAVPPQDGK